MLGKSELGSLVRKLEIGNQWNGMYKYQYEIHDMLIKYIESKMKLVHQEHNIITERDYRIKEKLVFDSWDLI